MLLKIITNTLKKVLFIDDKNRQQVHNICCSGIKTDLYCNFIVIILTRTGLYRHTWDTVFIETNNKKSKIQIFERDGNFNFSSLERE